MPGSSARSSSSLEPASAPIVSTPAARSRSSAFGPTPGSCARRTARGTRASRPAGTTVIPPGLRRSLAILRRPSSVETPSEHVRLVAPRTAVCTASATARARRKSPRPRRRRGSPRRSRCARPSARPRAPSPRRPASTRGRASGAGGRRPRAGSGGEPPRSTSPSGSRTAARRSSPSRRRRARAGRRRRPAASCGAPGPRAPRPRRRTRRGRGARRSGQHPLLVAQDRDGVAGAVDAVDARSPGRRS